MNLETQLSIPISLWTSKIEMLKKNSKLSFENIGPQIPSGSKMAKKPETVGPRMHPRMMLAGDL